MVLHLEVGRDAKLAFNVSQVLPFRSGTRDFLPTEIVASSHGLSRWNFFRRDAIDDLLIMYTRQRIANQRMNLFKNE